MAEKGTEQNDGTVKGSNLGKNLRKKVEDCKALEGAGDQVDHFEDVATPMNRATEMIPPARPRKHPAASKPA